MKSVGHPNIALAAEDGISVKFRGDWSGRRESNPRIKLGKLAFYH